MTTVVPPPADCIPCKQATASYILDASTIATHLTHLPLWKLVPISHPINPSTEQINTIQRSFTCKNFQAALSAINKIGEICEALNHHADLHLENYRDVRVVFYTHKVYGVLGVDIEAAGVVDEKGRFVYSPKWLKENPAALGTVFVE